MEKGVKAPCEEQRSASQCDREQSRVNKKKAGSQSGLFY